MIFHVKQFIREVASMGMELMQKMLAERTNTNDAAANLAKVSAIFYDQISILLEKMIETLIRIEAQLIKLEGMETTSQNIIKEEIKKDVQILKTMQKSTDEIFIPNISDSGEINNKSRDKKIIKRDLSEIATKIME